MSVFKLIVTFMILIVITLTIWGVYVLIKEPIDFSTLNNGVICSVNPDKTKVTVDSFNLLKQDGIINSQNKQINDMRKIFAKIERCDDLCANVGGTWNMNKNGCDVPDGNINVNENRLIFKDSDLDTSKNDEIDLCDSGKNVIITKAMYGDKDITDMIKKYQTSKQDETKKLNVFFK